MTELRAPFPYFGGKSSVADDVWDRFGSVKQYIEPFCGSAAVLLAAPKRASLEVIGDVNCYIANFWRCVKHQPRALFGHADYPVSHIDLYARHLWLTDPERRRVLVDSLLDPEWPGDAKIGGWWVWGQCCWIGSGWCDRARPDPARGQRGYGSASGPVDGATELGQIPHAGNAGRALTPHRLGAREWIMRLSERLERVRIVHGTWDRCLNHHYGGDQTAVFLDPPYLAFEKLYAAEGSQPVARDVEAWARDNASLRIAVCGHDGDYDLPGWECFEWSRSGNTYGGDGTKDRERIWFSPSCIKIRVPKQGSLFGEVA